MNPHALRHMILSHACLPVPTRPLRALDYTCHTAIPATSSLKIDHCSLIIYTCSIMSDPLIGKRLGSIRNPGSHRAGWHGDGLQGPAAGHESHRGAESPLHADGDQSHVPGALQARSADDRLAGARAYSARLRYGRAGRLGVHRHALHESRHAHVTHRTGAGPVEGCQQMDRADRLRRWIMPINAASSIAM